MPFPPIFQRIKKRAMSAKIFIANLPKDADESEIKDIFAKVGVHTLFLIGSTERLRKSDY